MKLAMAGRHVEVTAALRAFTEEKLRKLERLLDGSVEAHVVLAIEKHRHLAEIQVKSRLVTLSGAQETEDLYASIAEVVAKLERQALKHKEKVGDRRKRLGRKAGGVARTPAPEAVEPAAPAKRASRLRGVARPAVVRTVRHPLRPLSSEDAVLELEANQDVLLVYRDSTTFRVNVVYRTPDGGYGVVDPEF